MDHTPSTTPNWQTRLSISSNHTREGDNSKRKGIKETPSKRDDCPWRDMCGIMETNDLMMQSPGVFRIPVAANYHY